MKPLKVYLDTSVLSFLFAEDSPEFRRVTEDFFGNYVRANRYDTFVSTVVLREIEKTSDAIKKNRMLEITRSCGLRILTFGEEANRLAAAYVAERVVPPRKLEDAQHIAIATCHQMDILLSWNFRHLANIQKQLAVRVVNEKNGYYYPLTMTNPMELLYEED
ncbi:MAG: type II toxin-antitoxin system VapC family toxin [Candidatus Hydrogenedentes bacterium]|nr:type II toxin-antitoxin system VapC family toxin [Candidatus Hydrogenedentota bacterium]